MGRPKGRKNNPASKWCLFRSNEALREVLRNEIKKRDLGVQDIATMIGCNPGRVSDYFNDQGNRLTQFQLLELCTRMGIEIDVKFQFK